MKDGSSAGRFRIACACLRLLALALAEVDWVRCVVGANFGFRSTVPIRGVGTFLGLCLATRAKAITFTMVTGRIDMVPSDWLQIVQSRFGTRHRCLDSPKTGWTALPRPYPGPGRYIIHQLTIPCCVAAASGPGKAHGDGDGARPADDLVPWDEHGYDTLLVKESLSLSL